MQPFSYDSLPSYTPLSLFNNHPLSLPLPTHFPASHSPPLDNHAFQLCESHPPHLLEVPLRQSPLSPQEVLIRVKGTGVDIWDIRSLNGIVAVKEGKREWWAEEDGKWNRVLGRDIVGVVEEVGVKVRGLKVGMQVVCNATGARFENDEEEEQVLGKDRDGGWQQYVKVPYWKVEDIAELVRRSPTWATLVGEVAKVCQGYARIPDDVQKVLIVGGGIMAILWALVLREKDVQVVLCNGNERRRKLATDLSFVAHDFTEMKGMENAFDAVIECTGVAKMIPTCIQYAKSKGFILRCEPLPDAGSMDFVSEKEQRKSVIIERSTECSREAFLEAITTATVFSEKYTPSALGVQKYSISDYNAAIKDMQSEKVCKALFFLTDPRSRRFLASPAAPRLSPSSTPCGIEIPQLFL